ncbi:MAG: tRNA pseudouridine(55) synthase TruB [Caulobacter sp.]|nr:tRNA pseudouridine(55) synthase TruB [Vitreoscilla sp.]
MTDLQPVPTLDTAAAPAAARAPRPARVKIVRRPVHGVLLLDKPLGLSSNDALQKAKWLLRAEKAGHTGTLDPLATGLLPLCFGAATKFAQVSLDADKAYRATLRFGQTTRTGDAEGEVVQQRPVAFDRAALQAACAAFSGPIRQLPPMYSALKHNGKALYEYARDGIEIERAERDVTIHTIEITDWHPENPETATIEVRCSKGTYIRTLAESIGETLGCGAHLVGLRRTASGPLTLEDAITLEALEAMPEAERETRLLHPDTLLAEWPAVRLEANEAARFLTGLRRRTPEPDCAHLRVYGPEPHALLGSAHITAGELIADRLLSPAEVQGLLN